MRGLIDTHTLIWFVDQPQKLSATALAALTNPTFDVLVSAASIWEIGIKVGLGKLTLSQPYKPWVTQAVGVMRASLLPITLDYVERVTTLPFYHRDPFDRILAAQALVEGIPLVSADAAFDPYGVPRLW